MVSRHRDESCADAAASSAHPTASRRSIMRRNSTCASRISESHNELTSSAASSSIVRSNMSQLYTNIRSITSEKRNGYGLRLRRVPRLGGDRRDGSVGVGQNTELRCAAVTRAMRDYRERARRTLAIDDAALCEPPSAWLASVHPKPKYTRFRRAARPAARAGIVDLVRAVVSHDGRDHRRPTRRRA